LATEIEQDLRAQKKSDSRLTAEAVKSYLVSAINSISAGSVDKS